jgi:hypothetical protein
MVFQNLSEKDAFWNFGGIKPPDVPKCGFNGKTCPTSTFQQYMPVILGAIALFCVIVMAAILGTVTLIRQHNISPIFHVNSFKIVAECGDSRLSNAINSGKSRFRH